MSVINIKVDNLRKMGYNSLSEWLKNPDHIYIGRNMAFYVPGANKSKWCNPYNVEKYGRENCLHMYEKYILDNPDLLNSIEELRGKTLGCWCKPDSCHGDILIDILNRIR